jgi:hypothetical protein
LRECILRNEVTIKCLRKNEDVDDA